MTVPNVPKWAIYAGGAVALYLVWRAVTNPEGLGAAAGAGAVNLVGGAIKGVGSGVKGAIDGVVQAATGDESATLGTKIYDWLHPNEGKALTPPYVPQSTGASSVSDYIARLQTGTPGNGFDTFAQGAGGGF